MPWLNRQCTENLKYLPLIPVGNFCWILLSQADTGDKTQAGRICHFSWEDVAEESTRWIPQGSCVCSLVGEISLWSKFQELLSRFWPIDMWLMGLIISPFSSWLLGSRGQIGTPNFPAKDSEPHGAHFVFPFSYFSHLCPNFLTLLIFVSSCSVHVCLQPTWNPFWNKVGVKINK